MPIPDPDKERSKQRVVLQGDLPSPMAPPSGCVFRTRCPKASERCTRETPPLEEDGSGDSHLIACHHWRD